MEYFGAFYGLEGTYIKNRTEMLFDRFGISQFRDRKIGEFSTGMKQKLSIAVSLVHDPDRITSYNVCYTKLLRISYYLESSWSVM